MGGWKRWAMWLAGSVLVFSGAAIAGLASSETLLFGLVVSFMLILMGGLFWMEIGNTNEIEDKLSQ
jgi:hypothetical protein